MLNSPWLTPDEVADIADVTPRSVQKWCAGNHVRSVRVGHQWRINAEDFGLAIPLVPRQRMMSVAEVATWFRVSYKTVARLAQLGLLQTRQIRGNQRITREDLQEFIASASEREAS